jgi:hypothetical protein
VDQIFGDDSNKSEYDSWGNLNQVKFEECLLHSVQKYLPSFPSEEFMIKIYKTNFACGSVRVYNFVSHIKGGTQTEGVWEQSAEENIWM